MFKILSVILKKKKYAIITLIAVIIMAASSYYLTVVNVYHKSIFVFADMNGALFTIISLVLGLVIAVLSGFYLTLVVFRRDVIKAKAAGNKTAGLGGMAAGLIASGCPSCGTPLLGLAGMPLALFSLPFKGLELKILSAGFLILGIFLISKNIKKNLIGQCSVNPPIAKLINAI